MVIGTLRVTLYIYSSRSLKEKRSVVKSIVSKVRQKFNVSAAEVGSQDKWKMVELGISTVANDRRFVNSALDTILTYIHSLYLGEIVESDIEIFNV